MLLLARYARSTANINVISKKVVRYVVSFQAERRVDRLLVTSLALRATQAKLLQKPSPRQCLYTEHELSSSATG